MFLNCDLQETLENLLDSKGIKAVSPNGNQVLNIHCRDWFWGWSSSTMATWCEEPTPWKRPWCWERLRAEGGDRRWDDWMASLTQWIWVWANSGRWWRKKKPGVPQSIGSQRDTTERLNNNSFVTAFLPRNKHVLISWLQSPSAVIFYYSPNRN